MTTIRLTIRPDDTDANGRVVTRILDDANPVVEPVDFEVVLALFEELDGDKVVEWSEIDGDQYRAIESGTGAEYVLTWVRRGCDLDAAIDAAIDAVTPDGFDSDYEDAVEIRDSHIAALRRELARFIEYLAVASNGDGAYDAEMDRAAALLERTA